MRPSRSGRLWTLRQPGPVFAPGTIPPLVARRCSSASHKASSKLFGISARSMAAGRGGGGGGVGGGAGNGVSFQVGAWQLAVDSGSASSTSSPSSGRWCWFRHRINLRAAAPIGPQALGGSTEDISSRLSTFAFWSGVDRKISSQEFRGGDVTAIMGGAKLDFSQAKPVPGGAVIDLFVWWAASRCAFPRTGKSCSRAPC
jgi:hypothetical protein